MYLKIPIFRDFGTDLKFLTKNLSIFSYLLLQKAVFCPSSKTVFYCIGKIDFYLDPMWIFPYTTRLGYLNSPERSEWHVFRTRYKDLFSEMPFLYYIYITFLLKMLRIIYNIGIIWVY